MEGDSVIQQRAPALWIPSQERSLAVRHDSDCALLLA